jgi:hypothetical protein
LLLVAVPGHHVFNHLRASSGPILLQFQKFRLAGVCLDQEWKQIGGAARR